MRRAILLMVLLLFAPLLCLTPVTAQDSGATSVNISELGAFEHTNETYTDPAGNEYPVLFVGETFHLQGGLTDGSGEGIGMKCLNVYLNPETNNQPFSTLFTDENGLFDWFSGDSEDPFSHTGRIEPINGELVGFWSVRVAFEPQNATEGGCAADENGTHLASHVDAPFLLKSRVEIQTLGVEELQPFGVDCEENPCDGLYAGGAYVLNIRLMHDRYDGGVSNVSLTYQTGLKDENGLLVSVVEEATVRTNTTGHAALRLNISGDFCCKLDTRAEWTIRVDEIPFYDGWTGINDFNYTVFSEATILPYNVQDTDDDGDGVPNDVDACPSESAGEHDQNGDGCNDEDQWNLAIRFTDGCYFCTVEFRSITISVDNHTAYASDDNTNHSSINADQTITLTADQPHLEFVFDENHVEYNMSDFEEVQLEIDLKFNEALIYSQSTYCSTTSGRQFGGGGWAYIPSMDSHLEWNVEFQLNDGKESHEGHKILMNARSSSVCNEVYRHTITWSKDPTVDLDNDGSTLPGVTYEGICRENLITWTGLPCDFDRFYVYDLFPNDPTQRWDSDGDGYGDNISGINGDAFPYDSYQWSDADGDGYGDNHGWGALYGDDCPNLAGSSYRWVHGCPDADRDGIPDQCVDDSCLKTGGLTWDENGPGTGVVEIIDACPETYGGSSNTRYGCPDADDDGWADPTPASNVGYSDACPDRPGENEYRGCPSADGDAAGIGLFMTSIGGFCVGLVSILVFLKLLQVGMNEINPKRYSIASVDEDDIPEPVVSGLTSPSDLEEMIPTQVGWLDDTEKIADVEEEFVHMEDDQNAVSTQIGWLDDID